MVRRDAIHMFRGLGDASKKVAATHYQTDFNARPRDLRDFLGQTRNLVGIDPKGRLTGKHFAGQL
jgi:hypothetical protein